MHARRHWIVSSLALFLGAATTEGNAGTGFWSSTGPYGGFVESVSGDPVDGDILFAGTNGGVYRSFDGGDTWQRADSGLAGVRTGQIPIMVDRDRIQDLYVFDINRRLHFSGNRAVDWSLTGFSIGFGDFNYAPVGLVDVPGTTGALLLSMRDGRETPEIPLLRSVDGGVSFVPFGNGLPLGGILLGLAFDPDTPGLAVAVWGPAQDSSYATPQPYPPSIYRSTDGGANWSPVHTDPGLTQFIGQGLYGSISYAAGSVLYATNASGQVHRSENDGLTWTITNLFNATQLIAHASDPDTVYVRSGDQILLSTDAGATSTPLGADDLSPNLSYLSAVDNSPIGLDLMGMHVPPGFPDGDSRLWLASRGGGIFRSLNAGTGWSESNEGLAAANTRGLTVHPNPDLASASQGLRLYAGFGDSFYSSPALWRTNGLAALRWQTQNQGLQAGQIRYVVVDPTTARAGSTLGSSHVYAAGRSSFVDGYLNGGIYKSTNGGGSWSVIDAGLPESGFGSQIAPQVGTVRALAMDLRSCEAEPRPPLPDCVFLPAPGVGEPARGPLKRIYATANGVSSGFRVIRSDDAGANWINLDAPGSGIPPSRNVEIEHEGELYSVFESIIPLPIAISPDDPDRLFIATFSIAYCQRSSDSSACSPELTAKLSDPHSGVFRSDDRGTNWIAMNTGLPRKAGAFVNLVADALSMVMHPTDHDILWVSMSDFEAPPEQRPPAIFKTVDGGANWFASADGIPLGTDIRALVVDPGDGEVLYAAGGGSTANPGSIHRSDDGGATWRSISIGLPADSAFVLAIDPHSFNVLHAGTNTGVWSIEQLPDSDGDGIPDAVENFAPGGGDGNNDEQLDATQRQVGSTIVLFGLNRPEDIAIKVASQAEGGGGYVTSDVLGGTGTCEQAVDVQNRLASRYGRDYLPGLIDYYRYPRDLVQFEIMDCGAATIDVTFHNADFESSYGWSMRFHGPATPGDDASMGWHDISQRAELVAPNRWRLQLDANQFGSYRPVGDRIFFLGGPACYDDRILSAGFEAVSTALPGCNASTLR